MTGAWDLLYRKLRSFRSCTSMSVGAVYRRCGRPCAHAETCFAVLDNVVYMPVVSNDMCWGLQYRKLWSFRRCTSRSAGAVHRRLWTSLCSYKDVFAVLGQGCLHARCVQRQVLEVDSTENCGVSAVARRCLLVQFIDGCGRPCAHAETCYRPVVLQRQGFWTRHCLEVYRCSSSSQRQGSQCKLCRRPEIAWCSSGWSLTCPLVCQRQAMVQTVLKPVALCSDAGREKGRILRHFWIFYGDFLGPLMAHSFYCVLSRTGGRCRAIRVCQFVVHSGP